MLKFLIASLLVISFSTLGALEIYPLNEIPLEKIESSSIHFALLHAHETGDMTVLNDALEHASIETRTKQTEINTYEYDPAYDKPMLTLPAWEEGITPIEYAIRLQNPTLVKMLIFKGANIDSLRTCYKSWEYNGLTLSHRFPDSFYSYTPLYIAIMLGNTEIIKLLLDERSDTEGIFKTTILSGRTPWPHIQPLYTDIVYSAQTIASYLNNNELSSLFPE